MQAQGMQRKGDADSGTQSGVKRRPDGAPCCPCATRRVPQPARSALWALFGSIAAVGLALLIPGAVLLGQARSKSGKKGGTHAGGFVAGLVMLIIGILVVLGSLGPLVAAVTASSIKMRTPRLDADCVPCDCA